MTFLEKLDVLRLCTGGAIIGVLTVGAFGPAFGLRVTNATDLVAAGVGFVTMAILVAKRVI